MRKFIWIKVENYIAYARKWSKALLCEDKDEYAQKMYADEKCKYFLNYLKIRNNLNKEDIYDDILKNDKSYLPYYDYFFETPIDVNKHDKSINNGIARIYYADKYGVDAILGIENE